MKLGRKGVLKTLTVPTIAIKKVRLNILREIALFVTVVMISQSVLLIEHVSIILLILSIILTG